VYYNNSQLTYSVSLECTNYDVKDVKNTLYWNKEACSGYARCGSRQVDAGFGVDTGFDFRPQLAHATCQCNKHNADAYTKKAPMAQYKPGQKVCLAYPAKNHVAAECTNAYIPDAGVEIFRSQADKTSNESTADAPLGQWSVQYTHQNGVHKNGVIDFKGFQNCPKFCEDKGRALCTMCFQLEENIAPGLYSFLWQWEFNSNKDSYTSCWEAHVL